MLEDQTSEALLYGQKAVAVARAAKLQGSCYYAVLLKEMANIGVSLDQHDAIPFEGFRAAVAEVKRLSVSRGAASETELAWFDSFMQEHTCWVKELQAELVRCKILASCHLYCSQLVSPPLNSLCLTLSRS